MSGTELSTQDFADLMAELPAGVAIITTKAKDEDGVAKGLAVTSMTAYTAEPPSIMCAVAHSSRCHDHIVATDNFGVHLLHNGQEDIAKVFASKADDKFAKLDWDWDDDVPALNGALAYMRCQLAATFAHGDHTIVIGDIQNVKRADGHPVDPMLYLRRKYAWRLS